MAFGSFDSGRQATPMAEINMIPLIDVMLVLLVIFIVTAPLLTNALKIDLPRASTSLNVPTPQHVSVAIDHDGRYYWNGTSLDKAQLTARAAVASRQEPQPEVQLRADKATTYQTLTDVMAILGKAGLARIAFISAPGEEKDRGR